MEKFTAWGFSLFLSIFMLCATAPASVPLKGSLPDRLRAYVEADPVDRGASLLEDEEGLVRVSLTFLAPPDAILLSELEDGGVRFYYSSKGVVHYNLRYPARCDAAGLMVLDTSTAIEKISVPSVQKPVPMLDWTRTEIGAQPSWYHAYTSAATAGNPWMLTGQGITIADIDSNMDISHPVFFRADAGYFAWVDVDHSGAFEPGIDGVDLDHDGDISEREVLQLVDVGAWISGWPPEMPPDATYDDEFTAGLDWLFLDMNGNRKRDAGLDPDDPDFPVTEETPAYGEPAFIVDDMNANGLLDPEEKLMRLGTSKIKALVHGPGLREHRRGENLIDYLNWQDLGMNMWEMSHATQALGIVAGGTAGLTRFGGIAPDAELILAAYTNLDYEVCVMWALAESPDIMLHEVGSWVDNFLDGSSDVEKAMDESTLNEGVIHINPAGNLGGSAKHAVLEVPAGETGEITINIPDWSDWRPITIAYFSFLWQADADRGLQFVICNQEGLCDEIEETGSSGGTIWEGSMFIAGWKSLSERNTYKFTAMLGDLHRAVDPLPIGTWVLRVTNPSSEHVKLHLYSADEISSWGRGVAWQEEFATDHYTVTHPGTADYSINVSAYAAHGAEDWGGETPRGSYRYYSSRGPRIDETPNMDVAAPDNPLTSAPPLVPEVGFGWGNYMAFGGTSGAGPHVAGGTALILQAMPELAGEAMRPTLQQAALVDELVTGMGDIPNQLWGYGRFRVFDVLFGEAPEDNEPPTIEVHPPEQVYTREVFSLVPEAADPDGDEDLLAVRWDFGYDGTWDTDWIEARPINYIYTEPQQVVVKVQVRDEFGMSAQTAFSFDVIEKPEQEPEQEADADVDADTDTDAGELDTSGGSCGCVVVR